MKKKSMKLKLEKFRVSKLDYAQKLKIRGGNSNLFDNGDDDDTGDGDVSETELNSLQ